MILMINVSMIEAYGTRLTENIKTQGYCTLVRPSHALVMFSP